MLNTKRYRSAWSLLVAACLLAACNSTPQTTEQVYVATPVVGTPDFIRPTEQSSAYPAPSENGEQTYPGPATTAQSEYPGPGTTEAPTDGRSESALASFKVADAAAKSEFNPAAVLYAIQPSTLMLANIGNPPVLPGWFFKFKVEGERREYIVLVVDGKISGATQAESAIEIDPPELPIDLSQVKLDSTQVKEQFDKLAPEKGWQTDKIYDYELINIQGKGPVWSVVDPATSQWLYSVSAANGNEVANPHQS